MSIPERVAALVVRYRRPIIAIMLLLTVAIGSGAGMVSQSSSLDQFQGDAPEIQAQEYTSENFSGGENVTQVQIVVRGDDVLSKESLLASLRFQQRLLANETVNDTLTDKNPVFGVENIVATTAIRQSSDERRDAPPTLQEQIDHLESMSDSDVEAVVAQVLGEDAESGALRLMPTEHEPGETSSDARMVVVRQSTDAPAGPETGDASDRLVDSQRAIQTLADSDEDEYAAFGFGLISEEIDQSMTDSLAIVGPFALLFVLVTLLVAYRDLLDIALGTAGIFVVLVWTFGFMGWADIAFNQIFVAVPVLLIGLSIDYAIHIFMRHREHHDADTGVFGAMRTGLAGVGAALVWVTATTVIGFLSNLISPLPPIRNFGVVSSFGIAAALLVFGALIPALKIELDSQLERFGVDRRKRAFGTGGGRLGTALSAGSVVAQRAPFALVAVILVVSAAGAYGAAGVDTSFDQEDFVADDPPDWMNSLPGPMAPGEYSAKDNLQYVNEHFLRQDRTGEILVRGDVTSDDTMQAVADAETTAAESDTAVVLSDDQPAVETPLTVMRSVAATDDSFARTFQQADTTGDGVPDQNVEAVYDELYATAPEQAASVIHRTENGEYEALRVVVSVRGDATSAAITDDMRTIAAGLETADRSAIATGTPVVNEVVQSQLLDTVIESLLITLISVFAFLAVAYRLVHGSATLGLVTLLPVALSVSWILGTMAVLGMPFNVLTGMITSLTVGLGVAYSIHISERYLLELDRQNSLSDAMQTSVTGTGGALLGSAATTVGGFGVLAFAILPPLRQFGIITGMTIIYAFLASVFVLPSLLVIWTHTFEPDASAVPHTADSAVGDGGVEEGGNG